MLPLSKKREQMCWGKASFNSLVYFVFIGLAVTLCNIWLLISCWIHYKLSFTFYRTILWIWDIISLNLVLFITSLTVSRADALNRNEYYFFSAAVNLSWMASVYLLALYLSKEWLDFERFSKRTLKCYVVTLLSTLLFIFFYHFQYSRLFFIIFFSGFGFALLINRAIFYILVMVLKRQSRFRKNVIVLGYNDISKRLIS